MATPSIRIYDALKPALGERTTKEFIEALDASIVAKIEIMISDLATKGELNALRKEMHDMRAELIRTMYVMGLVQLIAIIGSLVAIIKTIS